MKHTIVAATQNKHKIVEIEAITKEFDMDIISRNEAGVPDIEIVEDGDTFEENSYCLLYTSKLLPCRYSRILLTVQDLRDGCSRR